MLNGKVIILYVVLATAYYGVQSATLRFIPSRIGDATDIGEQEMRPPAELVRARVGEGVPPPLCAGRCISPPAGPVCAFDAAGTARTFATLCELEAVSCRESTYYAITSLGEC